MDFGTVMQFNIELPDQSDAPPEAQIVEGSSHEILKEYDLTPYDFSDPT